LSKVFLAFEEVCCGSARRSYTARELFTSERLERGSWQL